MRRSAVRASSWAASRGRPALTELAGFDPQKARIVELKFFGGLTIDEIADFLGVSAPTVVRQWRRARLWLYTRLFEEPR